ncbi:MULTISPECIES: DsbE family thiol:disulfide interchange protein [Stappiaceae]|jgi:cytochrome c biogenesis protein CcmG/thiol:disulfide interchange protein DsbE|uniref:DsbE family thiol:disulfide interchange protein n=1 Tax=Stappiaceae TaxID=2821832 RepID=UPI0003B91290|nr:MULTISPECIES: DsbE family thiol:disulfide interchange protein [Stappiaceae]MCR9283222.1 DsbE family thiol:disulfide interchange protein [Paracoccaceae bacterium]MEC9403787.1 DsbE family thiol:disulfide interchange protein [Pseudomonadota bacterium]ERP87639.1 thiol:disulfide interchange protein [Labrenzia sp. C1B10]ERS07942.1 thiol:disulfide interchange protein [Labrenzia sp. C1B70]MBN8184824.1 DsbE family thiol:disulfide interchange protein [Roseibium aggregatum]
MTSHDTGAGRHGQQTAKRGFPVLVLLPLVVFAALAALFLFQLTLGGDPQKIPSALINKPAPEFDLPPVEGLTDGDTAVAGFSRQDLIGKVSVVNVFASWCVPCRQEHPLLEELAKVEGIQLLGINYKDKPENARRFLGSLGNPYQRVGADTGGRTAIEWGVYGVPETFVVDGEGTIRYKFIGPLSPESYYDVFLPELQKIMDGNKS